MVLHPLEFSECFLDSPWFRQSIKEHEDELERTNTQIKLLIKDAKAMLQACRKQGEMMQAFSDRLKKFQFEIIGENLTDTEKGIAGSLKEFGVMLEEIEGEWTRTIERSELQLIEPLEKFRKDHIHSYRESKKFFDKSSDRYYKQLEQTLGLSHKKKEQQLMESDNELMQQKKNFHKVSLNYVYKLQEVQERKKFEFVEHLLMFMQVYFNFFHQTHETANDCKEYMSDIQMRLVSTRSQYEGTRDKTKMLLQKMMDNPSTGTREDSENHSPQRVIGQRWARAGYLFLLEKNALGSRFTAKWARYFCMYTKENRLFQMLPPFNQSSSSSSSAVARINHGGMAIAVDPLIVLSCVRRATESIDKRFCFDIEVEDSAGKQAQLTLQAISLSDRKKWIAAMDGKEPSYTLTEYKKPEEFDLNENSVKFVKAVIEEIERRGVDAEGIYRLVGVSSKVDRLLQTVMDPATHGNLNYHDDAEWELNTLTSALKNFFRNLPEPIMTYALHEDFISAAKHEDPAERMNRVINLVSKLPAESEQVLQILIRHLKKVASCWHTNKMTVQNLGVCFGPTLMRPRQETVQSIMEIKFNNIIVEILIEHYSSIFCHDECMGEKKAIGPRPVDSRPSLRFKSRMKSSQARRTALQSHEAGSRFHRGHAIRAVPGRSPSPMSQGKATSARAEVQEDAEDSQSSDSNVDEFGRMAPLDLKLNLDHFSSTFTNLQSETAVTNPVTEPRMQREDWLIDQRQNRKTVLDGRRRDTVRRTAKSSRSERTRSPPNLNLNQNNSAHLAGASSSPSVEKRKDEIIPSAGTRHRRQASEGLPKNADIKPKAPPFQQIGKRPNSHQHDCRMEPQQVTGVLNFEKLMKNFSPDDGVLLPNSRCSKVGDSEELVQQFLRSKVDGAQPNNITEGNSGVEMRPRSSVLSSREDVAPREDGRSVEMGKVYVALYQCEAEHDTELSFKKDAVIYNVRPSDEPGWLLGTVGHKTGLIPNNYVREKVVK